MPAPLHLRDLHQRLADAVVTMPGVVAVGLGGSRASGLADEASDTDLYAFFRHPLPTAVDRHTALTAVFSAGDVREDTTFGLEDHVVLADHLIEVVYLDLDDLTHQVDHAYADGLADEGYATAFLHTVTSSIVLADPAGDLATLRERLTTYPEATRRRMIATLPPLLDIYLAQLDTAAARQDLTSVQQRRTHVQTVYFSLLFAVNRRYHPGEKRLLDHGESCPVRPADHRRRWTRVCRLAADSPALRRELRTLVDDLVALSTTT